MKQHTIKSKTKARAARKEVELYKEFSKHKKDPEPCIGSFFAIRERVRFK